MAKIILFPEKRTPDPQTVKLKFLSDSIDAVIVDGIANLDLPPKEVALILAHRLGTLLKNVDRKSELWEFYQSLLLKQADLQE